MSNLANQIREQDIVDHLINTDQEFTVDNWQGAGDYLVTILCDTCNGYGVLDASPDYTNTPIECDECDGVSNKEIRFNADDIEDFADNFDYFSITKETLKGIIKW